MPKTISLYLVKGSEFALIESGPSSISTRVCSTLDDLGVSLTDIAYILLTHIHVDHSGGTWSLLEKMPKAKVMIHPQEVKNLMDPSGRISSQPPKVLKYLLEKWGQVNPISAQRILAVQNGQMLNLGEMELQFLDAPGHMPYQMVINDASNHVLFPGDAMGIYYPGIDAVVPASLPPDFDFEIAIRTLQRLSELGTELLCLPHYGPIYDTKTFFERVIQTHKQWWEIVTKESNSDLERLTERIIREFPEYQVLMRDPLGLGALQLSISGFTNCFQKRLKKL
jgi:glyoxylase-like metal-dependent hydrolase (beta-lactamase superfamily II)